MIFKLIYFFTFLLFLFHITRVSLYHIFLWQLKEYRLDRLLAFLKTNQGKRIILNPFNILKYLIIIFFPLFIFLKESIFLVFLVYLLETLVVFRRGKKALSFPKFTPKAILILLLASFILFLVSQILYLEFGLYLVVLDRLHPIIVFLVLILINIPSFLLKKVIAGGAKYKILKQKDLLVIGITGSFGKTSTKEYLAAILAKKYRVLKTFGSQNTEIGVAKTILTKLKKEHNCFIVEMGAYKKGEIRAISRMVRPKIGIITGINEQHLELFGSLKNIIETKFELVESLQKNGKVFFNFRNNYVRQMSDMCKKVRKDLEIFKYQSTNINSFKKDIKKEKKTIQAFDIKVGTEELQFKVSTEGKTYSIKTNLLGSQNVDNILACILVSLELGLKFPEIKSSIENLHPPEKTMKRITSKRQVKITLVDDTFNSNIDAIEKILEYMKIFSGNKILVLTPLIEMGKNANKIHEALGKECVSVCDLLLLTNMNYFKDIKRGAGKVREGTSKIKIWTDEVFEMIKSKYNKKDSIIVFEGKEAARALEKFKS